MTTHQRSIKHALASRGLYEDSSGKQKEIESLAAVLERLGLGSYQIEPSESPDFFVSFKKDNSELVLGCEMTNLYSDSVQGDKTPGSPQRRLFEKWKRIAKALRHQLDQAGLENIYGVLFFKDSSPSALDSCRASELITELVRICKEQPPSSTPIIFPVQGFPLLSKLLTQLGLYQYPEKGILWWCAHLRSGLVSDPGNALINVIAAKSAKAQSYAWKDAAEKWLLIVAEARMVTDTVTGIDDFQLESIADAPLGFTRIILWDRFLDEIIELFPVFKKRCDSQAQTRNLENYPEAIRPFILKGPRYPTRIKPS
jgi:hypothetical protein